MRSVVPYGPRVVAKLRVPPETTAGGIIITQSAQQATEAIVIDSRCEDIVAGDVLIFIPDSGIRINVDGDEYIVLHEKEILAVVHGT